MTNEIQIVVRMTIKVDRCISKEIKYLIEKQRIETLFSCCGHIGKRGWVMVGGDSIQKMLSLGYEQVESDKMWCVKIGKRPRTTAGYITSRFELHSVCNCRSNPPHAEANLQRKDGA